MRIGILILVSAALVRAQESAPARDPATLFPLSTPVWVELDAISPAAEALRGTALTSALDPPGRTGLDGLLADLAGAGLEGRAAIGFLPALILSNRWIVVAETDTPARLLALIAKHAKDKKLKPATARIAPWCVIADSSDTIDDVMALREGKDKPLAERDDFRRYRARAKTGVVRFHLDLKSLAPRLLRFGLNKKD